MPALLFELSGLPAAGKTTCAEEILRRSNARRIQCVYVPEAASRMTVRTTRGTWRYNAWALCTVLSDILRAQAAPSTRLIVADRGLFDSLCWFRWLEARGAIKPEFAAAFRRLIDVPDWSDGNSAVCFLRVSYTTSISRRGGSQGYIVNPQTFLEVERAYVATLAECSGRWKGREVCEINTDGLSINDEVGLVVDVLHKIDSKIDLRE